MFWKKCKLCKQGNPDGYVAFDTYQCQKTGAFREKHYYHNSCLKKVCQNPEFCHDHVIDLALRILEEIEDQKQREIDRQAEIKRKCNKLREMDCG